MKARSRASTGVVLAAIGPGALLAPLSSDAEEATQTVAFYLMGVALDGETSIGPVSTDINMSMSDVFSHLEFGGMGAYRWDSRPWAFQVDVNYASLKGEDTFTVASVPVRSEATLDQAMIEVSGGYQLSDALELTFGGRYWDYDVELIVASSVGGGARADRREEWIDPFVGLRVDAPISERWTFIARGDIGGFGVGSDFAWHATAYFNWGVSEQFSVLMGYRVFDVDYVDGEGSKRFELDQMQHGPGVGVSFAF